MALRAPRSVHVRQPVCMSCLREGEMPATYVDLPLRGMGAPAAAGRSPSPQQANLAMR